MELNNHDFEMMNFIQERLDENNNFQMAKELRMIIRKLKRVN